MEQKILNYRVIIGKEKRAGKTQKYVYNASCPVLGLADYGETLDKAVQRITALIKFHVESLQELGYPIPIETEATTIITSIEIPMKSDLKFSYV